MNKGDVIADRYELLELYRGGLFTEVWRVSDGLLGRECLLKMPKVPPSSPQEARQFINEAQAMARIADKSHIAEVFDAGEHEGRPYFTQELVTGGSLSEYLDRHGGKLGVEEGLRQLIDVCEGIRCAHEVGVVHGDIKPDNVVLTENGRAKVVDFGTAIRLSRSTLPLDQVMATLEYQAPEHYRPGQYGKVDHRTDIWALGVTMYVVLAGSHPYRLSPDAGYVAWADAVQQPPDLQHAPAETRSIIAKCLQPFKRDRYQTVEQLLSDLKKVRAQREQTPVSKARRLLAEGIKLYKTEKYDEALKLLEQAEHFATSPNLLAWKGVVLECLGRPGAAFNAYEEAVALDPQTESAKHSLQRLRASGLAADEPEFVDKEITCACGRTFIWSAGEQEWYRDKGFDPPKRCPECREKKKQRAAAGQPNRYQGTVKMVSADRDWGHIQVPGMPDIYFHITGLKYDRMPVPGEKVLFQLTKNPRKPTRPMAIEVEPV
ncbi:MAG: protein kinase [Armatimonadota bacterium]|nr:protein kinase [Armatimonadota bacterium]